MSLNKLISETIPFNRKERYFTGTVFPMIVCRDNFKHFKIFLRMIRPVKKIPIRVQPGKENILFFTEYSLADSIHGKSKQKFPRPPKTKDIPDILILIKTAKAKFLIAIEAKMFHHPDAKSLIRQLKNQRNQILEYLKKKKTIDDYCHFALLPEQLYKELQKEGFRHKTITWQNLYKKYEPVIKNDYFSNILKFALDRWDDLASPAYQYGTHSERKMNGLEIYNRFKNGELSEKTMGRLYGINGKDIRDDIDSGRWQSRRYEIGPHRNFKKRNWFLVKEFVAKAKKTRKINRP